MIEIHNVKNLLQMQEDDSSLSDPTPSSPFRIHVRYLRAQTTGETICIGVELIDSLRNLTETRRYMVLTELISALNLHRGDISREKLEEIERASHLSAAYARALSILAYGANSAQALALKLRQRGFDAATATDAIALLRKRGYLREQADALREAERCLTKGWGRRRIELYLQQRGYGSEAVRQAICDLGDLDDEQRCATIARRKSSTSPADIKEKQKLIAYLIRQGYDMTTIRNALEIAWEDEN